MKKIILLILTASIIFTGSLYTWAASVKDRIPPTVTSSIPYAEQKNVGVGVVLSIKFNEVITKGNSFTKILFTSGGKTIPLVLSIKDTSVTVVPSTKLAWATDYTLTIPAAAVKDRAGNALAKPYIIKFKTLAAPVPLSDELKQVFEGVGKLSIANPGSLVLADKDWLPLAAVQYEPIHNVFAAARKYGNGRILALGKDDILSNDNIYTLDNLKFLKNAFVWLNINRSKRVGYSVGHGEFIDEGALTNLTKELTKDKFVFSSAALTADGLKNKDILIIGNPWKSLSTSEVTAVNSFVSNGGSLILAGLGWSYEAYNPNSVYPMDTLSALYGVKWSKSAISDTLEKYKDAPVFDLTLRDARVQDKMLQDSMDYIKKITEAHPSDLPEVIQKDSVIFNRYASSLNKIMSLGVSDSFKQKEYEFFKDMASNYPQYYSKGATFNSNLYPNITWLRERFIKAWIDLAPPTEAANIEIAKIAQIKGNYKKIWDDFGIYIADNNALNSKQTEQIYDFLQLIPKNMHSIRIISVDEYLGPKPLEFSNFTGALDGINIFKFSIGEVSENSFPPDVSEGIGDIFTLVLAHEINHVIDSYYIEQNPSLQKRKAELLSKAGKFPDNYLRSMFEIGFFANAPQEFFASMSNEWFTSSAKTIQLGLNRFDKGSKQPVNQALFFAEVYSQGSSSTFLYNSDASGNITRITVPLTRDEKGRIKSLTFYGYRYDFVLDAAGDVISYTTTKM